MVQALELLFDPSTEAVIKAIWAQLETAGVSTLASWTHRRHQPHVTLVVGERIEVPQDQSAADRLAATHLDITLYSPAVFPQPGVLYLSVVPTLALLRLHEQVHAAVRDIIAPLDGYSVGAWMPHCTLAQDLTRAQLVRAIDLLHDQPVITAHVSIVGLIDTTTGHVVPLAELQLHR